MMLQAKSASKIIEDFKTLTKLICKSVCSNIILYAFIIWNTIISKKFVQKDCSYTYTGGTWAPGSLNLGSFFQKIAGSHSGKFLQKEIFTKGIFCKKEFYKRKIFEDGAASINFEIYKRKVSHSGKFLQKEIFTKWVFCKKRFYKRKIFEGGATGGNFEIYKRKVPSYYELV